MKISIERKKSEALRRMDFLNIAGCIRKDFRDNDKVQIFETGFGFGYYADDSMKEVIKEFEQEHNALVYAGIKSFYQADGETWEIIALLYVSDYEDEWEDDNATLKQMMPYAYVYNKSVPDFSEIGTIGIKKTIAGGLKRTF